jgi:hypothetical protein
MFFIVRFLSVDAIAKLVPTDAKRLQTRAQLLAFDAAAIA